LVGKYFSCHEFAILSAAHCRVERKETLPEAQCSPKVTYIPRIPLSVTPVTTGDFFDYVLKRTINKTAGAQSLNAPMR
jgi:hypothetical protein